MKRLLVVVDYQNDFVEGSLGFPGAENLEEPIAKKIEEYRDSGDEIIFTFDTHSKKYLETQEGKYLPIEHCIEGSSGHELYGRIADLVGDNDTCLYKETFGSTGLIAFLGRRQHAAEALDARAFKSIELIGLVSNICVLSNAVVAKTVCPDVPIIIDASCTDSFDKELQEKAFDVLEGIHIDIINRKLVEL